MPESHFNKVAGLRSQVCNFVKRRLWRRCFLAKFPENTFFTELLWATASGKKKPILELKEMDSKQVFLMKLFASFILIFFYFLFLFLGDCLC